MSTHRFTSDFEKDPRMIVHEQEPFNAEPPAALLRKSFITPAALFYVRNHASVPMLDHASFELNIAGEIERATCFTLRKLKDRFPAHTVTATLQCAGNRRDAMMAVAQIKGEVPWRGEALGTARWTGVRLRDVLSNAGLKADARHIEFIGADRIEKGGERFGFGGSVEIEKAMSADVLLAFEMNGEALAPVHGAPLRAVVPGYIGARSVKWIKAINVLREPSANYYQQKAYRLFPTHAAPETAQSEEGIMLAALSINSCISAPANAARVDSGRVRVEGYATAGGEREVMRVEVTVDGGRTWQIAEMDGRGASGREESRWAWRLWSAELNLELGTHRIAVRAWDSAANTQPASAAEIWNFKGYMNNAWHTITVHAE